MRVAALLLALTPAPLLAQCPGGACPPALGGFGGGFAPAPVFAPQPFFPAFQPAAPAPVFLPAPAPAPARVQGPGCVRGCKCESCSGGCSCRTGGCGDAACRCLDAGNVLPPVRGQAPPKNFGLDVDKIGKGEGYAVNGVPVTREEAKRILRATASLTDDSALNRLTVIGTPAERAQVLADLDSHPALASQRGKWLVQGYDPSHPLLRFRGFTAAGSPAIWAQDRSGKVLLPKGEPLTAYPGPEALARLLAGEQPAPPKPDPKKPDDTKPAPAPSPTPDAVKWWEQVPVSVYMALAVAFLYLLGRK